MNAILVWRSLLKRPYVTGIGVFSLAFGIGATTAIFSLYYQLLLRPLSVTAPEALVNFSAPGPKAGAESCGDAGDCEYVFSYPMFRDLESQSSGVEGLAGHVAFAANLATNGVTTSGNGVLVSGKYFELLGLQPAMGRLLGPQDDGVPGSSTSVVLSYDYWTSTFAQNPGALDSALTVNGRQFRIVGVAPKGFAGTNLLAKPQVFVPLMARSLVQSGIGPAVFHDRQNHWLYVFGRLKPGIQKADAASAMNVSFHNILSDVEAPAISGFSAESMKRFKARRLLLEDGRHGQSVVLATARAPLSLLFLVAGLVLGIVCTNLANLLLVQAAERSAEIAIRLSIGASRSQLIAQLLTEYVGLAIAGGVGAMVVSNWTLRVVVGMFSEATAYIHTGATPVVLLFAGAITLVAGVAFCLVPAFRATQPKLLATLRGHGARATAGRGTSRFRTILATAQIALSLLLLISAALFCKSLLNVSRVNLGVDVEDVVTFRVSPGLNGYTTEKSHAFLEQLEEQLKALPGVRGLAAARVAVLADDNWGNEVTVQGFVSGPDVDQHSNLNFISQNFFSTLGMRFKSGRDFTPADRLEQPKVAIVNEAFAKKFNLGPNPVGRRMRVGRGEGPLDIEIVGFVGDAKYSAVKQQVPPVYFLPYRQRLSVGTMSFYVRSGQDTVALASSLRGVVAQLDPNLPVEQVMTLEKKAAETTAIDRMLATLSSTFALLATFIAATGLYGVLAYTVARRTREIGLRIAVGARPGQIRTMILRQLGLMALIGSAIGIVAAVVVGRLAQSLLFDLRADDPFTIFMATSFLILVTFTAGLIPAYRASKVHPMDALRYE